MTLVEFTEYTLPADAEQLRRARAHVPNGPLRIVKESVTAVLSRPNYTIICQGPDRVFVAEPLSVVEARLISA